jgi:hypothetical protein
MYIRPNRQGEEHKAQLIQLFSVEKGLAGEAKSNILKR